MEQSLELAKAVHDCRLCPLAQTRKGVSVPSMPGSRYEKGGIALMADVVTSDTDAAAGKPYVGQRAEVRLLESMLEEAGLSRDDVLLMFRVRCSPPQGRVDDYPEALYNCTVWTAREMECYAPGVVVLMGPASLKEVFGAESRVTKSRGIPRMTGARFTYGARIWLPTFNPYASLHSKSNYGMIVRDLGLAKELHDGAYGP